MRKISAIIVTYNSELDIVPLLGALRLQSIRIDELIVVDNNSSDHSLTLVKRYWPESVIIKNQQNFGFARAANQGIDKSRFDTVLLINPDVIPDEKFVEKLVAALYFEKNISIACGKLLRFDKRANQDVIDSVGITMTPSMRHLDRGANEVDRGQYNRAAYVFGASGAALLAKKFILEKVKVGGDVFDERFHSYREDADLAWRLQLAGYRSIYTYKAVARHKRRVRPERRRQLPKWINSNCVRNRYLMRINNFTPDLLPATLLHTTARDIVVLAACMTIERSSIKGLKEFVYLLPDSFKRRKEMSKIIKKNLGLDRWFKKGYVEELKGSEP